MFRGSFGQFERLNLKYRFLISKQATWVPAGWRGVDGDISLLPQVLGELTPVGCSLNLNGTVVVILFPDT